MLGIYLFAFDRFSTVLVPMVLVLLIWMIYRSIKKPTEMLIHDDKIEVNGHTIQANEIKVIMRMGYFKPVFGIKPYGKWIVPMPYCFSFANDEDRGTKDLFTWAEKNEVKVQVDKFFRRWI